MAVVTVNIPDNELEEADSFICSEPEKRNRSKIFTSAIRDWLIKQKEANVA